MPRLWIRPMRARAVDAEHRAATPLELFFDLCFVVAVAQAATSLEHALDADHVGQALGRYPIAFFAIWWAWMNFTWFASAYDNDDVPYRLTTLLQIAGVLVLAAGIPRAFDDGEWEVVTLGYLIMRVALVGQWLRAARNDPEHRATDRRYAFGVGACMVGWGVLLLLPQGATTAVGWLVMVALELSVPVWAESAGTTTWHPSHIAERYGLFTLIVLGEAVLAATIAVQEGFDLGEGKGDLLVVAVGGLLVVFSMWWLYFGQPNEEVVGRARAAFETVSSGSFIWGYGHLVVFASAAAVGAGLSVVVAQVVGASELTARGALAAVSIPVTLFLLSVWVLNRHPRWQLDAPSLAFPAVALLVPVVALVWPSTLVVGLLLVALVVLTEWTTPTGPPAP